MYIKLPLKNDIKHIINETSNAHPLLFIMMY